MLSPPDSLRDNNLGTRGWCTIFAALRDNKDNKIKSWDVSSQGIDVEIVKVLAKYVSASTTLKSLVCVLPCPTLTTVSSR